MVRGSQISNELFNGVLYQPNYYFIHLLGLSRGVFNQRGGKMSGLQFMNQDGEWEKFPPDSQIAAQAKERLFLDALQVRIICHLCNSPVPKEQLVFWIQGVALTWSCNKCNAVNDSKP
jgi:hypothetical protein